MWILKMHIAISILSWLSANCMRIIFRESYKRYQTDGSKKNRISIERMAMYACPLLNIFMPVYLLYMAAASDDQVKRIQSKSNENAKAGD